MVVSFQATPRRLCWILKIHLSHFHLEIRFFLTICTTTSSLFVFPYRQDKSRSNKIQCIHDDSVASQFCPAKDQLNPSSKCLLTTGQRYILFYTKSLILSSSLTEFSSEEMCNLNFISNYLFKWLQYIFCVFIVHVVYIPSPLHYKRINIFQDYVQKEEEHERTHRTVIGGTLYLVVSQTDCQ